MVNRPGVPSRGIWGHPVLREEVLEAYPNAKIATQPRTLNEDELIEFLQDCDGAITGMEPITERVLSALPNLKVIGKFGVGCDTVDFDALIRHQVRFGHFPGTNRRSVAELALCFMIAALRHVIPLNQAMRAGERPGILPGRHLSGRVVGIHGIGNVGKEVVRLLQPFECEILACDIVDYADFHKLYGITPVSFEELLARSEVLSIHLPLDARVTTLQRGDDDPPLVIARDLFRVGKQIADEAAIPLVLGRDRLETPAELDPRRARIERQARVGVGNGEDEVGA